MENLEKTQTEASSVVIESAKTLEKNKAKFIGYVLKVLFAGVVAFICILIAGKVGGSTPYVPQTPSAETAYNSWKRQEAIKECLMVKQLAQAILSDVANGVVIEGRDLNSMPSKAKAECGESSIDTITEIPASPEQSLIIPVARAEAPVALVKDKRVVSSTVKAPAEKTLVSSRSGYPNMQGSSTKQQEYLDYAWEISKDKTFIYLLKAENGFISPDRLSMIVGKNGYRDVGFCQINKGYHKGIVNDKRFFTDWKWQMQQCLALYKGGTRFYGLRHIGSVKKYFTWEK